MIVLGYLVNCLHQQNLKHVLSFFKEVDQNGSSTINYHKIRIVYFYNKCDLEKFLEKLNIITLEFNLQKRSWKIPFVKSCDRLLKWVNNYLVQLFLV